MNDIILLELPARAEYLPVVRAMLGRILSTVLKDDRLENRLNLAVEEALANVIEHAYEGVDGKYLRIRVKIYPDRIIFSILDQGKKTPPDRIKPRPLDEIRPGGLGTHFIREIMDEVCYDLSPPEGTLLRMVKYIPVSKEKTNNEC